MFYSRVGAMVGVQAGAGQKIRLRLHPKIPAMAPASGNPGKIAIHLSILPKLGFPFRKRVNFWVFYLLDPDLHLPCGFESRRSAVQCEPVRI